MTRTAQELVTEAKAEIEEVDVGEAQRRLVEGGVALDVREADELERGHVPGAVHIPRGLLEMQVGEREATKDPATPVLVYCAAGGRAALAAQTLQRMGYDNVASIAGGFGAWVQAGQPVALAESEGGDEAE